jgi:hypothetical protein
LDNSIMSRESPKKPDLRKVAEVAAKGIRDPEAAKKAREETDRVREEIFRKHGILDIGTPAIRELRDE